MRNLMRGRDALGESELRRLGDEELMRLVAGGDARAFEIVYERHCASAFSLAYRVCGVRAVAEEVAQEAFLVVWRSGARYDPRRGSVRSWLLSVVHNRAIDTVRRASVRDRLQARLEAGAGDGAAPERTELEVARRDEARSMRALIIALPDEQQRVVELAYFGGFTQDEIARMLDLPLGTVKGRMRLALEKLRASVEPSEVLV
jgi:RNA polymerase sigma-70 factor (ECF subfamily)